MELHWCPTPGGNFGDDLNLQLWPRLFPDLRGHQHNTLLYGIGTLLGGRHDPAVRKVVLGSGRGDRHSPRAGPNWDFRWVRGPLTAQRMGLSLDQALGDGAWLWDGLAGPLRPDGHLGLIPHCSTWNAFDWPQVAELAGMVAIDPRQAPARVAAGMRGCRAILTESLHGAIFADAMGIPWAVCRLSYRFNEFKWRDWMAFVGRPFEPHDAALPLVRGLSRHKAVTNRLARWTNFRPQWRYNPLRPLASATPADAGRVAEGLAALGCDGSRFGCSRSSFVARQQQRMLEACADFARDYGLAFTPAASGETSLTPPMPLVAGRAPAAVRAPAHCGPALRPG